MSYEYSEDALIEQATQDVLEELGWTVVTAWRNESFGENGLLGRESKNEVVLSRYLLQALRILNPDHPETAYEQAVELLAQNIADQTLGFVNKEKSLLLKNGVPVSYTNDKGEKVEQTEWHRVSAWGKTVDIIEQLLKKGSHVAIEGKLTHRSYDDKDGNKRYITEVVANELVLLN